MAKCQVGRCVLESVSFVGVFGIQPMSVTKIHHPVCCFLQQRRNGFLFGFSAGGEILREFDSHTA